MTPTVTVETLARSIFIAINECDPAIEADHINAAFERRPGCGGAWISADDCRKAAKISLAALASAPAGMMDTAASAYAAEYVMSTEGSDYEPTDWERQLIEDALHGFLSERSLARPQSAVVPAGDGVATRLKYDAPQGTGQFEVFDPEPDNHHSPLYLVDPNGAAFNVSCWDEVGLDIARAEWMRDTLNAALARPRAAVGEPADTVALVIAARDFWADHNDFSEESMALDRALEAFSERVPYENDPDHLQSPPAKVDG